MTPTCHALAALLDAHEPSPNSRRTRKCPLLRLHSCVRGSRVFLDLCGSTKRTQLRRAGPNPYHEARASRSSLEFSSDWAWNVSGGISGSGAGRPVSRLISRRIATAVSWDSFLNSRPASAAEKTSSTLLPCSNAKCVFFQACQPFA